MSPAIAWLSSGRITATGGATSAADLATSMNNAGVRSSRSQNAEVRAGRARARVAGASGGRNSASNSVPCTSSLGTKREALLGLLYCGPWPRWPTNGEMNSSQLLGK